MEKLIQVLATIFYLVWIPLGLLLLAGIVFLIVANPLAGIMDLLGGGIPSEGGFQPTEEMIQQFLQQGSPSEGQFRPPAQ